MNQLIKKNIEYVYKNILTKHQHKDLPIHHFKKNQTFIYQDQELTKLYILLEGRLKVTANYENGKSILLSFINGLYLLGDIEYSINSKATCQVDALTDITYVEVTYEELNSMYKTSSEFMEFLLKYISSKLLQGTNRLQYFNIYSLKTKLCSYLFSISNYGEETTIKLPHLQDLSNNLITSYRHLQRTLKELEQSGYIRRELHKLTILNIQKIKELSRGNIYEEQFNEKEI